jgi:2-hydroxychromene-2-carboxylate isomerase
MCRWPTASPFSVRERAGVLSIRLRCIGGGFLATRDMSNDEQIGAALKDVGQSPDRIIALARGDALQRELVSATERAKGLGAFGSPTFVVGEEVFWGDDRLDDAITWAQHGALQPK